MCPVHSKWRYYHRHIQIFLIFVFKINIYIPQLSRVSSLFFSQSLVTRSFFSLYLILFTFEFLPGLLSFFFHDHSPISFHKNENFRDTKRTANGDRSLEALTKNRFPKTRGMHWHARRCYNTIISHERNVSGKRDKRQASESLTTWTFHWVHFVHNHALSRALFRLISGTHLRHSTWILLRCIFRTNVTCGNCKIGLRLLD